MHILTIDQGTTGTTACAVDEQGRIVARAYRELPQIFPHPGWVEHDPETIWRTAQETAAEVVRAVDGAIAAVGITNQRETTVVWDTESGEPVMNAIVWQCRRSADICRALEPHAGLFRRKTGLPLDPYFSGTKIRWILDHLPASIDVNRLKFGTVDSWLMWKLTGGAVHATDYTNASRTLLLNIHSRCWDIELCDLLGVPPALLPEVRPSAAPYGEVRAFAPLAGVPILGVVGDQQAALFGQCCFEAGQIKNTYGTGCFVVMNTGDEAVASESGLITTLAADGRGNPCYALEGSIFIAGAALQWLRDGLGILATAAESQAAARSVDSTDGVYFVPALTGLGAPHWAAEARGVIAGLTRGTRRPHLIRAALEAIAYQTADVVAVMERESGLPIHTLAVDGGAAGNDFLMQFQADILALPIRRPESVESTSLGAAFLAGLQAGVWRDSDELNQLQRVDREFRPQMTARERQELLAGWQQALRRTLLA